MASSDRKHGLVRRLLDQARPHSWGIAAILLVNLLSTPLALLAPVPLKIAVDSVVGSYPLPGIIAALFPEAVTGSDGAKLLLAVILLVVVALSSLLLELVDVLLRTYTGERLVLDFRAALFGHIQRLSLSYADSRGTADSTYRIQYDAQDIQAVVIGGVIPFVTAGFTLAGMIYVTARIDWQLAIVAMVVSPILFVVLRTYRQRLRQRSRQVKKLESDALSVIQEVLSTLRVVKAFGQEEWEQQRFIRRSSEGMWARVQLAMVEGGFGFLVGITMALGTSAVLLIGIQHVQSGIITLGELLLVMGYLSQLYAPLKTISRKAASLQSNLTGAERAFALLDQAPDVLERPRARPLARASGAVAFRDVSFAYESDHPVLEHITFEIPPGTRVGIAGATGAGKTTLVSLLTRFYDPTAGQILLDGVDLRDYRLADLRSQFAIVLQDPVLFSTSIAENISYARPGASDSDIIAAAQAAGAHPFILGLPQAYGTLVGERGMRLSGGERQRIALARAFLKQAPILILDEPTSSIDVNTEAEIMESMEHLMQGRTAFMIAHRLSTLTKCDLLLRIENRRIAEMSADGLTLINERTVVGERGAQFRWSGTDA